MRSRVDMCEHLTQTYEEVDLFTPALVDFAFWLDKNEPETPIRDQIMVMEQVARLYEGRIHPFAPFDPWRQIHAAALGVPKDEQPLAWIKDAVLNRGFIGVKLYPPMGFRLFLNTTYERHAGNNFGAKLDEVLLDVYRWCGENSVPILTHCAASNHAHGGNTDRWVDSPAHPKFWGAALDALGEEESPIPPINFGHFGGLESKVTEPCTSRDQGFWPGKIGRLIAEEYPSAKIYADLSDFDNLRLKKTRQRVADFIDCFADAYPRSSERLMYGSDWIMLARTRKWKKYLNHFKQVASSLGDNRGLLGMNAVRFLGLSEGEKTRERLSLFYKKYEIDQPEWMYKANLEIA